LVFNGIIYQWFDLIDEIKRPFFYFYSYFIFDTYSTFCKFFFIIFLIIIGLFSEFKIISDRVLCADIYIPILFILFFALFLLSAFDLFSAYLALEGVSLSVYTLAANTYYKRTSIEATIKYFVFGGISNGILLFGNSIIFGLCGSLQYLEVKYLLNTLSFNISSIELYTALICFVIVFFF
jgi:NADH-quinone oxidoreductase subunit N